MKSSVLLNMFGIRGYKHVKTEENQGKLVIHIRRNQRQLRCSACGSNEVSTRGSVERTFKTVPVGSKLVDLSVTVPRIMCFHCQVLRQGKVSFADPRVRYTRALETYVLQLSQCMTIQDVASHVGMTWDTVKDIQKRYLGKRFARPPLNGLEAIAIDEIAIAKGHRYVTLVMNLKTGAVVFVGEGKGAEALEPFWKRLQQARLTGTIKAVAIDMSPAYISAVRDNLPKAVMVFDHFHVVKLFNDKLSDFRRDYQRQMETLEEKKLLKGTRWLLLKNPENLDPKKTKRSGSKRRLS